MQCAYHPLGLHHLEAIEVCHFGPLQKYIHGKKLWPLHHLRKNQRTTDSTKDIVNSVQTRL